MFKNYVFVKSRTFQRDMHEEWANRIQDS
jgi:hypothetical protein